jgi:Fic family protein
MRGVRGPPPHEDVAALLGDLEKYLHADDALPPLVRIGLAHVQFETIHPYLDGNGRIGRLLVALLLEHWNVLSSPLLYLSLYFKRHRAEYYRLLGEVRKTGVGILEETSGMQRDRTYAYRAYLEKLRAGTELE